MLLPRCVLVHLFGQRFVLEFQLGKGRERSTSVKYLWRRRGLGAYTYLSYLYQRRFQRGGGAHPNIRTLYPTARSTTKTNTTKTNTTTKHQVSQTFLLNIEKEKKNNRKIENLTVPQSVPTWLCWPYLIVVWNWTCRSLCHHPLSNIAKQKNRVGVVNSTSKRLKKKLQCTEIVIGLKVYGQFQRAFINLVHTTNMYVPWSLPTTGTATRRPFCPIRGATLRPTETERNSRQFLL